MYESEYILISQNAKRQDKTYAYVKTRHHVASPSPHMVNRLVKLWKEKHPEEQGKNVSVHYFMPKGMTIDEYIEKKGTPTAADLEARKLTKGKKPEMIKVT